MARSAPDDGALQDWHFDLLRASHRASDAEINKAFRRAMLRAHPDKNGGENANDSERKSRLLNEARERLLDKVKRADYAQRLSTPLLFSLEYISKGDIVAIHGLMCNPEYNGMHGRVVETPCYLSSDDRCTLELQHRRQQFDLGYAGERKTLKVKRSMLQRLYGDTERGEYSRCWSTYFPQGARVEIDGVQEAPWYNGREAAVCGYNYDLGRWEVRLHPFDGSAERLAFKSHNISLAVRDPTEGLAEALQENERLLARVQALEAASAAGRAGAGNGPGEPAPGEPAPAEPAEPAEQPETPPFDPGVGDDVEVRCANGAGAKRRYSWLVGCIEHIAEGDNGERRYDVRMPRTSPQQPNALRRVEKHEIQPKRKRGLKR